MQLLRLRSVLVATDLDPSSLAAIESGQRLARVSGAALHIVHVSSGDEPKAREPLGALLRHAGVEHHSATLHALEGGASSTIGTLANRIKPDVIVLGPHRKRGANRTSVLGSTALAVVTDSFAPCLVVREALRVPVAHVTAAIDLSEAARGTLIVGLSWASALRAARSTEDSPMPVTLNAVHVRRAGPSESTLDTPRALAHELVRIRDDAGNWAGVTIREEIVSGDDVAEAIVDCANRHHAELIVLGTRALGVESVGRIGSVAHNVLGLSSAPVLLVPPAFWMSHANPTAAR